MWELIGRVSAALLICLALAFIAGTVLFGIGELIKMVRRRK